MNKETIKNLLLEGAVNMSEEQIALAIRMRFMRFGDYSVSRRISSGGRFGRVFSNTCNVYFINEEGSFERVSPQSGWKIEQAARFVFNQLHQPAGV